MDREPLDGEHVAVTGRGVAARLPGFVALIGLLGAAAAYLVATTAPDRDGWLAWPVLAAAFAATELAVVHLRFRREAFSFTLHEAVLIVAVLGAPPTHVFLAMLVGSGVVMAGVQRMGPVKVVFNLGQYLLGGAVVAVVLGPRSDAVMDRPVGWLLAVGTASLVGVCTMFLIAAVIRLAQDTPMRATVTDSAPSSLAVTLISTTLGLTIAVVAHESPVHVWLLAPTVALVALGIRAHHRLQVHAGQLELVHDTVRSIADADDPELALGELATRALRAMGAERAVLVRTGSSGPERRLVVDAGGARWGAAAEGDAELLATIVAGGGAVRIARETNLLRTVFDQDTPAQALGVALAVGGRVHGALVVVQAAGADPAGERELELLGSLARHAALALEANQLATVNASLRGRDGHDPLLGLPTFAGLSDAVLGARGPVALLYVSLSGIEAVNDLHGFDVGDRLLIGAAGRLRNLVRPGDVIARIGGDEFAVLIDEATDPFAIEAFGDRVIQQLSVPFRIEGLDETVEISAGVGIGVDEHHELGAGELLRLAHEHLRRRRMRRHLGIPGF